MYSLKIEQAIKAASLLHQGQFRLSHMSCPYISHLISVAMLVSDYTDNEDVIVAALLHDTIEDTDYTATDILTDFGPAVRDFVLSLSETKERDGQKIPWLERKKEYFEKLKSAPKEVLLIAAADKIHNMRSAIEDYYPAPDKFVSDFGGSLSERLVAYQKIGNLLNRRLKSGIVHEFNHIFAEYRDFIKYVKKETSI